MADRRDAGKFETSNVNQRQRFFEDIPWLEEIQKFARDMSPLGSWCCEIGCIALLPIVVARWMFASMAMMSRGFDFSTETYVKKTSEKVAFFLSQPFFFSFSFLLETRDRRRLVKQPHSVSLVSRIPMF